MWAHLRKKEVYYIEGVTLLVLYLRSRVICRDNLSTDDEKKRPFCR